MTAGKWAAAAGIGLALASGGVLAAPPSAAKVQQLIELMGVPAQFTAMNEQIPALMGQQLPCVEASFWQAYINKNSQQQLLQALIPAYQQHFSADEVDGLIKFYKTPLGQKLVSQLPAANADAAKAVQQWVRQRTDEMFSELQKAGKLDGQGRCPATGTAAGGAPAAAGSAAAKP